MVLQLIYASGSVPFIPETMEIIEGGIEAQAVSLVKIDITDISSSFPDHRNH